MASFLCTKFPDIREGELSRIRSHMVCAESLAKVAKQLALGPDILLGPGEMKSGAHRRDSILGDTVEALIGAVFMDAGFHVVTDCILRWFKPLLDNAEQIRPTKDPKTTLQEFLQQRGQPLPEYKVLEAGGEPHKRLYTVCCNIDYLNQEYSATATSRRKAEQMVAEQFLDAIEVNSNDLLDSLCGYVAIVGRPNVGKSTLLNHLLGQKLCITSRKPQTTRHTLLGIKTQDNVQIIYVDTPGIHTNQDKAINRVMNRSASSVIADVDVVVFLLDRCEWSEADEYVAKQLSNISVPILVALNKVDMINSRDDLLPHIDFFKNKG